MNLIHDKIKKWIPTKSDTTSFNNFLLKLYTLCLGIDFSPGIKQFTQRISKIKYDFTSAAYSSGAVCFYFSMIMSLLQLGYINNIDQLFTFSSCYILIDHFLDDETIPMEIKIKNIKQINEFIGSVTSDTTNFNTNSNNITKIDSPIIQAVGDKYIEMVTQLPGTTKHLKELFHAEVKTMYLQTHDNLDRKTYLDICEWKGGLTCTAIQSLLGLEITEAEYKLGSSIQLIDDMLDINDDIKSKINTIATHDYKKYGNLDELLIYTIEQIDAIDNKYNFYKPILFLELVLAVHTHRDKYTTTMIELIEPFIHYSPEMTKDGIFKWFQDKLAPHFNKLKTE